MAIFDISRKEPKKIYTFEEVIGGKIDLKGMNYNSKSFLSLFFSPILKGLFLIFTLTFVFSLVDGEGDVTFNARRNILASISRKQKIAYHLHSIGYSGQKGDYSVQLLRKSKWLKQYSIYSLRKLSFNFLILDSMATFLQIKTPLLRVLISILLESSSRLSLLMEGAWYQMSTLAVAVLVETITRNTVNYSLITFTILTLD